MPRSDIRTATLVELPLEQYPDVRQGIQPTHDRIPTYAPAVQIAVPFLSYHFVSRRCLPLSLDLRFHVDEEGVLGAHVVFQNDGIQHRAIIPLLDEKSRKWAIFCLSHGLVVLVACHDSKETPPHQTVLHGLHRPDNVTPLLTDLVRPCRRRTAVDGWIEASLSEEAPSAFSQWTVFSRTDYIYHAST